MSAPAPPLPGVTNTALKVLFRVLPQRGEDRAADDRPEDPERDYHADRPSNDVENDQQRGVIHAKSIARCDGQRRTP